MKNSFIVTTFVVIFVNAYAGQLEPSNTECANFIAEIGEYKKNRTFPPIIVNKEFPSTEPLIFQYQNIADFSRRLKNYLDNLNNISNEKNYKFSFECQELSNLSEDINKTKKLKLEFEKKILDNLSNVLETAYQKTPKDIVDVRSCNGYGDKATKFISEFYKSTKQEDIDWIDKNIKIYENCKLDEKNRLDAKNQNLENNKKENNSLSIQASKDTNLSSDIARCENFKAYSRKEPTTKRWQVLAKDCELHEKNRLDAKNQNNTLNHNVENDIVQRNVDDCNEALNNTIRHPNDPKYKKIYNECKKPKKGEK